MGAPRFYYYPLSGGVLKTISFSALTSNVTDFDDDPVIVGDSAVTQTGRDYTVVQRSAPRVRIYFRRLKRYTDTGALVERQLRGFIDHLRRGGVCAFTMDTDKAWAAFAQGPVNQGDTYIDTHGDMFGGAFESSPAPASGDEVWIQGGYPERRRELMKVTAWIAGSQRVTLGADVSIETIAPTLVHTRDFWPVMVLPAELRGQKLLTVERGRHFTLDMTLELDTGRVDTLGAGAAAGGQEFGGESQGSSLDLESIPGNDRTDMTRFGGR